MKIVQKYSVRKISSVGLSLALLFATVTPALATGYVLGTTTSEAHPQIPPTAEGPGFILPDNPFFALDELKQSIRVAMALTPEAKIAVHTSIAGERFAELRYMLDRDNEKGIETDLLGVSQNMEAVAENVHEAQLAGHNIALMAKSVNDNMKAKQQVLDTLALATSGAVHSWAMATADSLALAKAEVEKALPADLAANEAKDDAARNVVLGVKNATGSAKPTVAPSSTSSATPKK